MSEQDRMRIARFALERGENARRIVEDPICAQVVQALDDAYVLGWRTAETAEEREMYHAKQRALAEMWIELKNLVVEGEVAVNTIKRHNDQSEGVNA